MKEFNTISICFTKTLKESIINKIGSSNAYDFFYLSDSMQVFLLELCQAQFIFAITLSEPQGYNLRTRKTV